MQGHNNDVTQIYKRGIPMVLKEGAQEERVGEEREGEKREEVG